MPILLDNPRGLLLAVDELNAWLGGHDRYAGKGGADVWRWLSMHSAGAVQVDRKTGTPRTLYVPAAAVRINAASMVLFIGLFRLPGAALRCSGQSAPG